MQNYPRLAAGADKGMMMAEQGGWDVPSRLAEADGHWGPWVLDLKLLTICCKGYEIDLERISTSGEMLDIIMQVARKSWATDDLLASLVRALNDIFEPQAYLCSRGMLKTITKPFEFLRSRIADPEPKYE